MKKTLALLFSLALMSQAHAVVVVAAHPVVVAPHPVVVAHPAPVVAPKPVAPPVKVEAARPMSTPFVAPVIAHHSCDKGKDDKCK